MAILLYARVSTARQAERELSIAAQFHLMERYAKDHNLSEVGRYQDVSSGRSLRDRPGLLAAVREASRDRSIDGLLVHKIDRLARNTFTYLVLKGRLQQAGVRIRSVVESLEASPMGEFFEHIMAAQAEFYSANLSTEVKKGLHERLRRGLWSGIAPVGYLKERGRAIIDPARGRFIRIAFERWSTGNVTSYALSEELHQLGFLSAQGKKVTGPKVCRILQNPFYAGTMVSGGTTYPGTHPPLVNRELFDRAQIIFRQKRGDGSTARKHLTFLLSRLVRCPRCASLLVGELHRKPSGTEYRYYRCHQQTCRYYARAAELETLVVAELLALDLPNRLVPLLRHRLRAARRTEAERQGDRVRALRAERRRVEADLKALAISYVRGQLDDSGYDLERGNLSATLRATEWLLAAGNEDDATRGDRQLLDVVSTLPERLRHADPVVRREAFESLVEQVHVGPQLVLMLRPMVAELLRS